MQLFFVLAALRVSPGVKWKRTLLRMSVNCKLLKDLDKSYLEYVLY